MQSFGGAININTALFGAKISQKIPFLSVFKMVANQTGLNRSLSSNIWWQRSANHLKFTEEYMMFMKKYVLQIR